MVTFGRSMLSQWLLDPEFTYLNHGTVGATPVRVLRKQQALRDEMERQPARFMIRELNGHSPAPWRTTTRLREAIEPVAAFVGARADDLVFVPSVSTGLNAVLRSLPFVPGDDIIVSDLAYGASAIAARAAAAVHGATVRTIDMPFPVREPDQIAAAFAAALTPRTKLAVVDHVSATTGVVLPLAAISALCHRHGVPVLVDGAHAPGSLALDIPSLGVDWYSANLHKWAFAPRSCGILWAAPERKSGLHYPVVSWGFDQGYLQEFELTATSDPTPFLAAPEGIALFREWQLERVLAYNHGLAWQAAELLTTRWGTVLQTPRAMFGSMIAVPLPAEAGASADDAARLRLALLLDEHIEVHVVTWHGRLWARVSAQVYNELADVERLGDAVLRQVQQIA